MGWQSGEWRVADGSDGLAPAASCFAARGCLYGAFVVAGAAPDRRQLPLSGGELTLDAGNTLTLRPPYSNLKPRSPTRALTLMNMARDASAHHRSRALSVGYQPKPVAGSSTVALYGRCGSTSRVASQYLPRALPRDPESHVHSEAGPRTGTGTKLSSKEQMPEAPKGEAAPAEVQPTFACPATSSIAPPGSR